LGCIEIARSGDTHRAGNMAGGVIDGFLAAGKPFFSTRIDPGSGTVVQQTGGINLPGQRGSSGKVATGPIRYLRFQWQAGSEPRRRTAVEHRHGVVPKPAEQPPGAGRKHSTHVVVDDNLHGGIDSPATQPFEEAIRIRERMPPAVSRGGRKIAVEIAQDGARDVTFGKHPGTESGIPQPRAAIDDSSGAGRAKEICKASRFNQSIEATSHGLNCAPVGGCRETHHYTHPKTGLRPKVAAAAQRLKHKGRAKTIWRPRGCGARITQIPTNEVDVLLDLLAEGLVPWNVWAIVAYTLIVTHITIVSVTVFLHRHSAHRALELHPALAHFFRFWLWITTGMGTKEWTAIHRKHHATCETAEDPHSPQVMGLGKIFWKGVEMYRLAGTPETLARYGAGSPDDWVERNLYSKHTWLGIILMATTNVLLFGGIGITIWAIQMVWIPLFAAGVINGIGHFWGYRNYECGDAARNILPWGILIGGEELHNNHHTYPNSAKLSSKPWEFDIGWFWIRLFETFGLARVRSKGPVARRVEGKASLDLDTAWAILNDRFRVMSRYAEQVITPSVRTEYGKADAATRRVLRRARKALARESSIVTQRQQSTIDYVVKASHELRLIYEHRLALNEVWAKRANAEELLSGLRAWCVKAEQSGIHALQEFVTELKTYAMPAPRTA